DQSADRPARVSSWCRFDRQRRATEQRDREAPEQCRREREADGASDRDQVGDARQQAAAEHREVHADAERPHRATGPGKRRLTDRWLAEPGVVRRVHEIAFRARASTRCCAKMNWRRPLASFGGMSSKAQPASQTLLPPRSYFWTRRTRAWTLTS